MTCTDERGNFVSFRDIRGDDLEYLDFMLKGEDPTITNKQVVELLGHLCTRELDFNCLIPRAIKSLYLEVQKNVLCNYVSKEIWLRQCYSIQNGSFQNLADMELVPMSKFVAMCTIHQQAMDQIENPNSVDPFSE